jgi:SMI1 / KNR4 family (SUKH-1)
MNSFYDRYRKMGLTGGRLYDDSIDDLQEQLGLPIPDAYRDYLCIAGSSPPPALIGSDCTVNDIYDLREVVIECLEEDKNPFLLPDNAIVFFMHQGYFFYYFLADGVTDDPAVYFYRSGTTKEVTQVNYRFSDWIYMHAITSDRWP